MKSLEVIEERSESGELLLTYPLTLRPWLLRLAQRMGLRSNEPLSRKLQLDEMGTLAWSLMDGKKTVQDMADLISHRYKLNRREAEVAITTFLRELGRKGLIAFLPPYPKENENSA
jgi:hypothetical protein